MNLFSPMRPSDVFTPRAAAVNDRMYIGRPDLEDEIRRALDSRIHMIIHGESGSGKTWLYKKAFAKLQVQVFSVNMANAHRFNSLDRAFQEFVNALSHERKTLRSVELTAEIDGLVASGGSTITSEYEQVEPEPFLKCLRLISTNKPTVLVFDNFESVIQSPSLIKSVGDVLILLDDESYAKYDVRIAIVGVPNDIRRYFSNISNSATIANRVREIPEVARLSFEQTKELVTRGFTSLHYLVRPLDLMIKLIAWLSDRIPQQIQELCLEIALVAEESREVDSKVIEKGVERWVNSSLISNYNAVTQVMNARETGIGRRNQTLFVLGQIEGEDFRTSDVEAELRIQFPDDTNGITLNISQVLSSIASSHSPLIKKHGDEWRFVHPKYRMCLRAILKRSEEGVVEKIDFRSATNFFPTL